MSAEPFPVILTDDFYKSLATTKGNIVRFLKKNFKENIHYRLHKTSIQKHGGMNYIDVYATKETADLVKSTYNLKHKYIDVVETVQFKQILMTLENSTIGFICNSFKHSGLTFIRQYPVGTYKVDLYIKELNLVLECDELGHKNYNIVYEDKRTEYISNYLHCKWVRFNPNASTFEISDVIAIIIKHVCEYYSGHYNSNHLVEITDVPKTSTSKDYKHYVDNDEDAPDSIPETVTPLIEPKAQTAFHVAQLSLDKIKVVNIYGAVCKAAEAVSSPACSICTAITRGTALKKFYWSKYDDLPDELKQTYTDPLPPLFKQVTCSKFVEKIDPLTDRVVEVLDTMQEVNAKYKISHKKLNDLTSSGDIYKGFKWRVVSKKANDAVKQDEQATVEDFIEQELPSETNACNVQQPNTPISNIEPVLPKTRKPSSAAQKVFKCSDSKAIIAVYETLKEAREAHDFKYSETEIRKVAKDSTILDGFRWVLSHEKVPEIPDTASTTKSHTKTYDHFAIVDHSTKEVLNVFASQKEVAEYLGISPALANKRFQDQNPIKGKQIWAWDKLPTPSKEAYLQKGGTLPIRKSAQSKSIIRIDPNTQEEHIYASIIDATDTLKVARRDILNAIKTNTSFHGYNWKWVQA